MDLFSYRNGITKYPDSFQTDSVSQGLKNRLWSCLNRSYFKDIYYPDIYGELQNKNHFILCRLIYDRLLKLPLDSLPREGKKAHLAIRNYYLNDTKRFEIYDLIEFCIKHGFKPYSKGFTECANKILTEEFSGFRIVGGQVTYLTNEQEISAIENALTSNNEISEHLNTALQHLSDKNKPDYPNSIKESISAVESMCRKILDDPNVTLGAALKEIEKSGKITFHGAEKQAFSNLFGWASVFGGIRHGKMNSEEIYPEEIYQEDARFMLVTCSAFTNLLRVKADKAGIKIK
ncbi:AbiJ-NTD4 domain-containing protein [Methanogenium organophilum]|uniref:HEPN AbiJ-N-terminal domain-containing protein n=1 Tax=Methanogenium organophilum TaxID=2199 RepID=A0A9X9S3I0_METOG|nr:hypothetical protein [Methanogenium organophilum]WAI01234.1 hypothetical protein OU421_12605 [Methanogenium organophilum]